MRVARRCWSSSAAARGSRASTRPPTRITARRAAARPRRRAWPAAHPAAAARVRRTRRQPRERDGRAGRQGRRPEAVARRALDARLRVVRSPRSRQDRTRRAGRFRAALRVAHAAAGAQPGAGQRGGQWRRGGRDGGQPLWPEWNTIIGGYFKFHWVDPQLITVKIDDPEEPADRDVPRPGVRDSRRDLHLQRRNRSRGTTSTC